jgi:hypothetical protein
MRPSTLAATLRVSLFADRGSDITAAWQFADDMLTGMPDAGSRAAARTALHVLVNTIANAINDLEPATIAPADQPDVGIDESRIAHMVDVHMARWLEDNFDIDHLAQEAIGQVIDDIDMEDMIGDAIKNMNFKVDIRAD